MAEAKTTKSMGNLLDHEYDGIREYDNPCPGWWSWLFFGTAVFAAFYFFYFHMGWAGITIHRAHENAVADNVRLRFAEIGELQPDEPTLLQYMRQPEWLQVGRSVYEQKCKSCHGTEGCGQVGPNLTDDFYKNVDKPVDILDVVRNGAANGSMPAWPRLHPNELLLVSSYVASLRGKNLPGPRGQEGKEIPPWPAAGDTAPEKTASGEGEAAADSDAAGDTSQDATTTPAE